MFSQRMVEPVLCSTTSSYKGLRFALRTMAIPWEFEVVVGRDVGDNTGLLRIMQNCILQQFFEAFSVSTITFSASAFCK